MNVPNMERRHFQFVADILANLDRDEFTHNQQIQLADLFADNLQRSNVNFGRTVQYPVTPLEYDR